jgi:hypothetical protein
MDADHLSEGDNLHFWLPIVVPAAAFSFTLPAAVSWWYTVAGPKEFLAGRRRWWFLAVLVAALSMTACIIGAQTCEATAVLLTAMVTTIGITYLWPPALSPPLLAALPKRGRRPTHPCQVRSSADVLRASTSRRSAGERSCVRTWTPMQGERQDQVGARTAPLGTQPPAGAVRR